MALADIVERIDRDGVTEAHAIVAEAQQRADSLVADTRKQAERSRALTVERAVREGRAEAETLLATTRLEARDRMLTAKRVLVDRALAGARASVLALSDDAYADLVARRIVAASRGGEKVLMAPADVSRLVERLPGAVVRAGGGGLALVWASQLAPVEHGVVLRGDRVSVDLSVDAAIEERREELAMLAAETLFGEAGV